MIEFVAFRRQDDLCKQKVPAAGERRRLRVRVLFTFRWFQKTDRR